MKGDDARSADAADAPRTTTLPLSEVSISRVPEGPALIRPAMHTVLPTCAESMLAFTRLQGARVGTREKVVKGTAHVHFRQHDNKYAKEGASEIALVP